MSEEQPLTEEALSELVGSGSKLDPVRLKFIMQSLEWPRGLYYVAYGAWLGAYGFGRVYWKDSWWGALWFLGSAATPFFLTIIWIPRYYARRFGILRPKPGPTPNPWSKKRIAVLVVILGACYLLATILKHFSHSRVDFAGLAPSLLLLAFVLIEPWRKLRSAVETRFIGAWAIIFALVALLPLWVPDNVQAQPLWKALGAAFLGITFVIFGFYDHITLTRLIPKIPAKEHHE